MKKRIRNLSEREKQQIGEKEYLQRLLKLYPTGIISAVSDTFNLWDVLTIYLPKLKEDILKRDGKLVIRPDSGDPVDIICGVSTKYEDLSEYFPEGEVLPEYFEDNLLEEVRENTPHGEHGVTEYENTYIVRGKLYKTKIHNISWNRYDKQYYFIDMWEKAKITIEELEWKSSDKGVIELLWDIFGGTINKQGYKVLDSHIGAIYGDSITLERAKQICERLKAKGFASTNIVLGIGSYTYQYNTRDTFGFAMKATCGKVKLHSSKCVETECNCEGTYCEKTIETREIFKDPITDDGTKRSKKGLLCVQQNETNGDLEVIDQCIEEQESKGLLTTVFKDGKLVKETTLDAIRLKLNG